MEAERVAVEAFRHLDALAVLLLGSSLALGLPGALREAGVPGELALAACVGLALAPAALVWAALLALAAKRSDVRAAAVPLSASDVGADVSALDAFCARAELLPQLLLEVAVLALVAAAQGALAKVCVAVAASALAPLLLPPISVALSRAEREPRLEELMERSFGFKVSFAGSIRTRAVNAYAVSSPLFKALYVTRGALELNEDTLLCLLAHELYHLKRCNSYVSSAIGLAAASLAFAGVSELLALGALEPERCLGLALLALYLPARLASPLALRALERRADIFAARLVGHEAYARFLSKLGREELALGPHPRLKDRVRAVRRDARAGAGTRTPV